MTKKTMRKIAKPRLKSTDVFYGPCEICQACRMVENPQEATPEGVCERLPKHEPLWKVAGHGCFLHIPPSRSYVVVQVTRRQKKVVKLRALRKAA